MKILTKYNRFRELGSSPHQPPKSKALPLVPTAVISTIASLWTMVDHFCCCFSDQDDDGNKKKTMVAAIVDWEIFSLVSPRFWKRNFRPETVRSRATSNIKHERVTGGKKCTYFDYILRTVSLHFYRTNLRRGTKAQTFSGKIITLMTTRTTATTAAG